MHILKIHSSASPITNSSTVIYTYQNSVNEAKELVQEILNLMGEDKKAEDVFYFGTFCPVGEYIGFLDSEDDLDDDLEMPTKSLNNYKKREDAIEELINKVLMGELEKPEWMKEAEISGNYMGFNPDLSLYMLEKESKYKELGDKIINFLNSVDADGGRDG